MSRAVKLMTVAEVGELFVRCGKLEICVEISVLVLRLFNYVDKSVGCLFKLGVGRHGKAVRNGFDPLCGVAVLEYKSSELALFKSCRDFEVLYGVARLGVRYFVVNGFPLVGDDFVYSDILILSPKVVADFYVLQRCKITFDEIHLFLQSSFYGDFIITND